MARMFSAEAESSEEEGGDALSEMSETPSPRVEPSPKPYDADHHKPYDADHPKELYDFSEALGWGTTAVVRKAVRRKDGTTVAVKQWQLPHADDDELRAMAKAEYDLMRSLDHRAIIRAESIHETSESVWIAMEFAMNGNVDDYVSEHGPFKEAVATALSLQLLSGVNYLHNKRVAHRDLKPQNLLLTEGASCLKIADFNSAKQIGGGQVMLSDRGTHMFSAPELRFGGDWNELVDIWACGLCIYFLVRGAVPFDITKSATARVLRGGNLPSIDWSGMGDLLRNLVMQCLALDMRDRPPVMELMMHPIFGSMCDSRPSPLNLQDAKARSRDALPMRSQSKSGRKTRKLRKARSLGPHYEERRQGLDMLRRLARSRCERTMAQDPVTSPFLFRRAVTEVEETQKLADEVQEGDGVGGEAMPGGPPHPLNAPAQGRHRARRACRRSPEKFFSTLGAPINDEEIADALSLNGISCEFPAAV
jgi:serine/threonine protein kinase